MGGKSGMVAAQGMNVVGGALNIGFAKRAAKDEINANVDYNARAQAELTRQQREANVAAAEAKGDRVEMAERELALLQVINAERGAGASMTDRQILDLGRIEGKDIGRIERARQNDIDSIQAEKVATATNINNANRAASNRALSQVTQAIFQMAGSGVQIYSDYDSRERMIKAASNKKER